MRAISILFTLFLLIAWFAIGRYAYVCMILKQCNPPAVETIVADNNATKNGAIENSRAKTLTLKYKSTTILEGYEEFDFKQNAVSPNLSSNNQTFLDDLATYLSNNPNRKIEVFGRYRPSEAQVKPGVFENLGLARANMIRQELINRGINESRIALNYEQSKTNTIQQPIYFKVFDKKKSPKEYAKVMYTFKDMTFSDANFEKKSHAFKPGKQFLLYADSMKAFLARNPKYTVTIIGHTDDDGNELYNESLGMKRAQSTKKYLQRKGIKNRIFTVSKGEEQPMAPNTNETNKRKNRRVNFILKK